MEAITYSLKLSGSSSEEYYKDVRCFTDEILIQAENSILLIVNEYTNYVKEYNLEEVSEKEEYLLELLSYGILWRTY